MGNWFFDHRKALAITLGILATCMLLVVCFHFFPAWKVWLGIWVTAVITPIILGMFGKVAFRWAVLWECVMFLPVVLLLVVFVQDIRNYVLKSKVV